jgi:hypothetical protein
MNYKITIIALALGLTGCATSATNPTPATNLSKGMGINTAEKILGNASGVSLDTFNSDRECRSYAYVDGRLQKYIDVIYNEGLIESYVDGNPTSQCLIASRYEDIAKKVADT